MCYNACHRCYGRVHMTPVDTKDCWKLIPVRRPPNLLVTTLKTLPVTSVAGHLKLTLLLTLS